MNPSFNPAETFTPHTAQSAVGASQIARDLTDQNLGDAMGPVQGSGHVYISFGYERVRLGGKRNEGKFQTRLIISRQPMGDRLTVSKRAISETDAARLYPQEFAMFKTYSEVPTTGTPLHELPGLSQSQIALLSLNGLRSIEDLVAVGEDAVGQIGMDAIHARKLGMIWEDRRRGHSDDIDLADLQAERETERLDFERRIKALEASNAKLEAANEGLRSIGAVQVGTQPVATQEPSAVSNQEDDIDPPSADDDPMLEGQSIANVDSEENLAGNDVGLPDPLNP